jgi:hypothetical protein
MPNRHTGTAVAKFHDERDILTLRRSIRERESSIGAGSRVVLRPCLPTLHAGRLADPIAHINAEPLRHLRVSALSAASRLFDEHRGFDPAD